MPTVKQKILLQLQKWYLGIAYQAIRQTVVETQDDLLALQFLAPLSNDFIPWTKPALRPGAVATILNDIVINQRTCILECGSGISTLYIARLLNKQAKGHLYSIEHDFNWLNTIKTMLTPEEQKMVTFIEAPLVSSELSLNKGQWYDASRIRTMLGQSKIDVLLVDGPPAATDDPFVRYPALPFFRQQLAQGCMIALDDVQRRGERIVWEKWHSLLTSSSTRLVGGMGMIMLGNAYKPFI